VQNIIYLLVHCVEYHLPPCPLCKISSTSLSTVQNIIYVLSTVQNIIYMLFRCAERHLSPCTLSRLLSSTSCPLCRISSTSLSTVQNIIYLPVYCAEYPSPPYLLRVLVPCWPVCLEQWRSFVRRQRIQADKPKVEERNFNCFRKTFFLLNTSNSVDTWHHHLLRRATVMQICMYVCMCVCMYACMYVCCMYVCVFVCMHVCMYVCCMYVRMYVCMYVCMYMCVCMY